MTESEKENKEPPTKPWWQEIAPILAALAALVGAITGLYAALSDKDSKEDLCRNKPFQELPVECLDKLGGK